MFGKGREQRQDSSSVGDYHVTPAAADALQDERTIRKILCHCGQNRKDFLTIFDCLILFRRRVVRLDVGDKDRDQKQAVYTEGQLSIPIGSEVPIERTSHSVRVLILLLRLSPIGANLEPLDERINVQLKSCINLI